MLLFNAIALQQNQDMGNNNVGLKSGREKELINPESTRKYELTWHMWVFYYSELGVDARVIDFQKKWEIVERDCPLSGSYFSLLCILAE